MAKHIPKQEWAQVLSDAHGRGFNKSQAAAWLGVSPATITANCKRYGDPWAKREPLATARMPRWRNCKLAKHWLREFGPEVILWSP